MDPIHETYNSSTVPFSSEPCEENSHQVAFERNLGRSLMAAYTDHYMSDFVLHGTSDSQFLAKVHSDLSMAVQVCIIGGLQTMCP